MKKMKKLRKYSNPWKRVPKRYRIIRRRKELIEEKNRCATTYYKRKSAKHSLLNSFRIYVKEDLRGWFKILPPKAILELSYNNFIPYFYKNLCNSS